MMMHQKVAHPSAKMKYIIKQLINKSLLACIFIIVILPLVSPMQDFTYFINKTENMSMINLNYGEDILFMDPWFRYDDYSLDDCINNLANGNEINQFSIRNLYLDCGEYSLYNFIKYIKENNFELILGSGLDSSEITSANQLASFFNITVINHDSDYNSVNDINNNVFIIGNSNKNTLTNELIGSWSYSSGESIARFIVNNSYVKIILGGTESADTIRIIDSIIEKTNYYESFTEDCILLEGCDYVCYPGDFNRDGFITVAETFVYLEDFSYKKVSEPDLTKAVKKWISEI